MLAWSGGIDMDVRKPKSWLWRHCGRLLLITPITLANVTLNPKLKSTGAGRYQLLSRWWDAYRKQLGLKDFSKKMDRWSALQQIKGVALYLWLIVVISVRQSTVAVNIWASLPGAGCRWFDLGLTAWLQFKETGGTVREIDVWAESPRLSPLWLSASSSACHGLLIITVITPLPTKPARQKCQRTEAGERGNCWHADASAWCCCARCKIHEGVSWC